MLGLESAVLPAVGAGPVPPPQKLDPFDRRIRALGLELAGSSPRVDRLSDIAVIAAVLCEIRRELLPMPLVIQPIGRGVLRRVPITPAAHSFTGFVRIPSDQLAGEIATEIRVIVQTWCRVVGAPISEMQHVLGRDKKRHIQW